MENKLLLQGAAIWDGYREFEMALCDSYQVRNRLYATAYLSNCHCCFWHPQCEMFALIVDNC